MKTTNHKIEASAPANVRPSSVSKDNTAHFANRALTTESVLNFLRSKLPHQYALAEVVGKWVWLGVSPARKPGMAKMPWALGFHWNQCRCVWQHPCGKFDPLGSHPHRPPRQVSLLFSRRRSPRLSKFAHEHRHQNNHGTVSETVSGSTR